MPNTSTATSPLSLSVSAVVRTRMNLGLHHLLAACRFAGTIREIEERHVDDIFSDFWNEILQNALGVVALSVAALESYANDLYFEGSILKNSLSPEAAQKIAKLIDKESILNKFDTALAIKTGKQLKHHSEIVQNISTLIKLRNAVVHFRSEWTDQQGLHEKLSKTLTHKFNPSPFLPNEPLFPGAWASASFAQWAIRSAIDFLDYFFAELAEPSPLAKFKDRAIDLAKISK